MKKFFLVATVILGVTAVMFNSRAMKAFAEEAHHEEGHKEEHAHEHGAKGESEQVLKKKVEGYELTLDIRPESPTTGGETEFEVKIVESIEKEAGGLGGEWPLLNAKVYFRFVKKGTPPSAAKEMKAHSESEGGVYGAHHAFQEAGEYEARIKVISEDGKVIETSFSFSVGGSKKGESAKHEEHGEHEGH